jgi:eukaryotic-like serine/threonine-protein kinase
MQIDCPFCQRTLEYSGEPPSFCGYCGQALRGQPRSLAGGVTSATAVAPAAEDAIPRKPGSTIDFDPNAPTLAPDKPLAQGGTETPGCVGAYRLIRELGSGGMGKVYEAEEANTGRRVALKLISAEYSRSADALERFRREGQLASQIAHPRCVFLSRGFSATADRLASGKYKDSKRSMTYRSSFPARATAFPARR